MIKETMGPPFFIILAVVDFIFCMGFCFIKMPENNKSNKEIEVHRVDSESTGHSS